MSKIHILDATIANQIAAGEVVERPASALKELVENALDAGADRLLAILEAGGKTLLALEDNGEGMDRDDALLAIERHATSKLGASADLDAIQSLGFRGEALPSIASVSRFVLTTREQGAEGGTRVEVDGGTIRKVEEVGAPPGTRVEIRNLFFNLPARRKFLKSPQTELAHCLRVLEEAAVAHPRVRFQATHNGRTSLELSPAGSRLDRIVDLHGGGVADWVSGLEERPELRLEVYASRKPGGKSRGRSFLFWVNGRPVQDRTLYHAVREGWALQKGVESPGLTLVFLDLPPEHVDVNIHPQKSEVRLRESGRIHDLLRDVLARTLRGSGAFPDAPVQTPPIPSPGTGVDAAFWGARQERIAESVNAWRERAQSAPELLGVSRWDAERVAPRQDGSHSMGATVSDVGGGAPVPLTQYQESYIIAHDPEGLLIVDQHVAHERVLYEKILAVLEQGDPARQKMLVPLVLEVSPHRVKLLEERLETIQQLGFDIEPFGGNAFRLTAAPADLPPGRIEETIQVLFDDIEEGRDRDRRAETAAASLACHAAIKVNNPLTPAKMRWLLAEWWQCGSPMVCPHGRPVALRLSHLDLERAFLRR